MNREWSVVLLGDDDGAVLSRIEAARSGLTVVRSCHELSEVLGTVLGGIADAVLFVGQPEDLTVSLLAEMRLAGAATAVLEDRPARELFGLVPVAPTASAELLSEALLLSSRTEPDLPQEPAGNDARDNGPSSAAGSLPHRSETTEALLQPDPAGKLLVVWGPAGAPGRTTIAVNAAAELARAGAAVCLVDADTSAASVGAVLGLVEETSGLSRACRAAERGHPVDELTEDVVDLVSVGGRDLAVLTGIPRPERWIEVRRPAFAEVLRGLRRRYDVVVADVAAPLEFDDADLFDDGVPQRYGATAECFAQAGEILAVGRPDAVGFPRLVRETETLGRIAGGEVRVLLNGVRQEAVGKDEEAQLLEAWTRYGSGPPPLGVLPWDADTCARSLLRGGLWCEEAPASALRGSLVAALARCDCGRLLADQALTSERGLRERWSSRVSRLRSRRSPSRTRTEAAAATEPQTVSG